MVLILKHQLTDLEVHLLKAVHNVSTAKGVSYLLVGAAARDIILKNVFDQSTGTATRDMDFAFALESWEESERMKQEFLSSDRFKESKIPQKIIFENADGKTLPVDLIPFGNLERPHGKITWPGHKGEVLDVMGFRGALKSVLPVQILDDLIIPVVSVPGLVVLKFLACRNRKHSVAHDASDIFMILKAYSELGNTDRLYGEEMPILEECGFDPKLGGARLLGQDVFQAYSPEISSIILSILEDQTSRNQLGMQMSRSLIFEEEQNIVHKLLEEFQRGLSGN